MNLSEALATADPARLLATLFGRRVTTAPAKAPLAPSSTTAPQMLARYSIDDGAEPAVSVCCDLGFAVRAGAACAMVPPNVANEAVTKKDLSGVTFDAFGEVMNVLGSLLNERGQRLRLIDVAMVKAPVVTAKPARDLEVNIDGYGAGRIVFVVAS